MAVNSFCRLCEVNLRIHGTISASKLIFDNRDKQENICSQLSKLRLVLLNTALFKSDSDRWQRNVGVSSDAGQAAKFKDCLTSYK